MALLLSACAAPVPETPTLVPRPRLVVTSALEPWLVDRLASYATATGAPEFEVDVLPPEAALGAVQDGRSVLAISAVEPPEGWFAAPVGLEGLAVLVHSENPSRSFSLSQLGGIFSGHITSWDALGGREARVQPVVPLDGDETREAVERLAMQGLATTPNAVLAPSPSVAVDLVEDDPNAIAYVPLSQDPKRTFKARVEGMLPTLRNIADGRYPLAIQILAMAPSEPTGPVRDWLVWLQTQEDNPH